MKIKINQSKTKENNQFYDLYVDGLTQGAIEKFLTCPQKFKLAIVDGLTNKYERSEAIDFGTLGHDCLDKVYTAFRDSENKPKFYSEIKEFFMGISGRTYKKKRMELEDDLVFESMSSDLEKHHGQMEKVMPFYFDVWKEDFECEWIALEEEFCIEVEVMPGIIFLIRGKRDGLKRKNSKLRLLETKFKGKIDEDHIEDSLSLDLQSNVYLWSVWKDYNEYPSGVDYNIVRRPQLRRGTKETLGDFLERTEKDVEERLDHYFMRFESLITPSEIREWETWFIGILREIYIKYTEANFYKNPTSCKTPWGSCPFLKICGQNNDSYYKKRSLPYPELSYRKIDEVEN